MIIFLLKYFVCLKKREYIGCFRIYLGPMKKKLIKKYIYGDGDDLRF